MACIVKRLVEDEIADALAALSDAERYLSDARTHLVQALGAKEAEQAGALQQARRVTGIAAGCLGEAQRHTGDAAARHLRAA
jgi:hypothetical protein